MNRNHINKSVVLALSAPFLVSSCASVGDMTKTTLGCIGGAIIGAGLTFANTGDPGKAALGALAGGAIGCAIGNYLDYREQQLKQAAKANGFEPKFERIAADDKNGASFSEDAEDNVIASQVSINSEKPLFDSAQFTVNDPEKLKRLKGFLNKYVESLGEGSKVYVVGHTDDTGSSAYNQKLSEQRAKYIATLLVEQGLNENNIYYEGVGESQPVANNNTIQGRARNRRFELVDVINKKVEDDTKQLNTAPVENLVEVARAKKTRIENVTNTLPEKKITKKPKPQVTASRAMRQESLDLGGVPLKSFDQQDLITAFGAQEADVSWGFFAKANANSETPIIGSCAYTSPVAQSQLKAFNGRPIRESKVSENLPNLYGNSWYGMAGTTAVTLGPIGIDKQTLDPTSTPIFNFYKNYKGGNVQPDYTYPVSVETYRGDGTVLVRMYAKDDNALMKCSDVVFSTNGHATTKASAVIYQDKRELMARAYQLEVVKG